MILREKISRFLEKPNWLYHKIIFDFPISLTARWHTTNLFLNVQMYAATERKSKEYFSSCFCFLLYLILPYVAKSEARREHVLWMIARKHVTCTLTFGIFGYRLTLHGAIVTVWNSDARCRMKNNYTISFGTLNIHWQGTMHERNNADFEDSGACAAGSQKSVNI